MYDKDSDSGSLSPVVLASLKQRESLNSQTIKEDPTQNEDFVITDDDIICELIDEIQSLQQRMDALESIVTDSITSRYIWTQVEAQVKASLNSMKHDIIARIPVQSHQPHIDDVATSLEYDLIRPLLEDQKREIMASLKNYVRKVVSEEISASKIPQVHDTTTEPDRLRQEQLRAAIRQKKLYREMMTTPAYESESSYF